MRGDAGGSGSSFRVLDELQPPVPAAQGGWLGSKFSWQGGGVCYRPLRPRALADPSGHDVSPGVEPAAQVWTSCTCGFSVVRHSVCERL